MKIINILIIVNEENKEIKNKNNMQFNVIY